MISPMPLYQEITDPSLEANTETVSLFIWHSFGEISSPLICQQVTISRPTPLRKPEFWDELDPYQPFQTMPQISTCKDRFHSDIGLLKSLQTTLDIVDNCPPKAQYPYPQYLSHYHDSFIL